MWLCRDTASANREVALKLLLESGDENEFRKEFATLAGLTHPNLPDTFAFGETASGSCYIALEFVDGDSFVDAVQSDRASFQSLASESLLALSFIHDFGLVHRDLKPQNLLVRRKPKNGRRLVLLDFGLAEARLGTNVGAAGTLRYMAPELFEGASPTAKTDFYALGVVFLEALIGRPPVDEDPAVDLSAYLHATKHPVLSDCLTTPVSKGLLDWLNDLRNHDPDARPADAREALAQLRTLAGGDIEVESAETRAARVASGSPPGRSEVLEAILEALQDPGITAVFLTGEAGAGKTRILDTVRARAVQWRWRIEATADWLVEPALAHQDDRTHFLPVDELENVTPEIANVLDRVVRNPFQDKQTKVLVCGRLEEISDPRIRALLADVEMMPTATHFELAPLDQTAVEDVLKRVSGGEPSPALVANVLAATNGLAASVEAFVVSGDKPTAGEGDRLRESVKTRLTSLSRIATRCVAALAVVGESSELKLLTSILGDTEANVLSGLNELGFANLSRELDGRWVLKSRVVTQCARDAIDQSLLDEIARRAIQSIENSDDAADSKLGRLWRQLGDHSKSSRFFAKAAASASQAGSNQLAVHWYTRSILDLPKHDPAYASLRLKHAHASELAEYFDKAAKSYAAYGRCRRDDSSRSCFLSWQARALIKAGRQKAAIRVAREAFSFAKDERQKNIADSLLGAAYATYGEPERGYELLNAAAPKLHAMDETRAAAEAFYSAGIALQKSRNLKSAIEAYEASICYAEEHGFDEIVVNSLISSASTDFLQENPDLALERLERAQSLATRHEFKRHSMWILGNKGRAFQMLGKFDRALECHEEARRRGQFFGNRVQYVTAQVACVENLITLGRPNQGTERLQKLELVSLDPRLRSFLTLTLAEALLSEPTREDTEIANALSRVLQGDATPRLAIWGHLIVTLEMHARFGTEPPEALWNQFQDMLGEEGLDQHLVARGWLAWSKEKVRRNNRRAALDACNKALEALSGRHHDLAAQVYLSMSKAHELDGRTVEANLVLEKGREELETAANLIEDEELRSDFLARPVFKELRKKRESFADAEERLGALYDMVHSLNSGDDPEGRLGVILDQALRVVRAERGLILLRSAGDDRYRVRLARNLEEDTVEEAAQFSRTAVLAAGKGEPVLAINTANDERVREMKSVSAYGIKSLLCVPLRLRDDLIGAVYADSRADGALFSRKDLAFLEALADHAALALENARDLRRLEQRKAQLLSASEARDGLGELVGRSPGMQKVYDMIERVGESDLPVLIQGDSGTGKELVAREIYRRSLRKDRPFLSENCAAIADSLLESELFGHVRGAFTGADKDKPGLFEQADGGTLFLDEVGDMSPAMQARLLRVLQDGDLRRVGGETSTRVDVRLITATHRDLSRRVAEGEFREDLLYRLQVLVIHLPPLRERPADIAQLVEHFLERIARQRGQKKIALRRDAMELLERYAWPGNVRQLENTLQRLALLAGPASIDRGTIEQDPSLAAALIGQAGKPTLSLKQNERDRIEEALRQAGGNRNDAARLLGVSRATIFRKIKQYGLS